VVGALGTGLNLGLLYLLAGVCGLDYLVAAVLATEATILGNFALNDCWTFFDAHAQRSWPRRVARYNTVALGGLGITIVMLAALTHVLHVYYLIAQLFAIAVATLWNYTATSRFAWKVPTDTPQILSDTGPGRPAPRSARRPTRRGHIPGALGSLAATGVILIALGWVIVARPGAWISVAALFLGTALALQLGIRGRSAIVIVLAIVTAISAVDYVSWRSGLINWANWWIALPLFVSEVFGALHTLGLQYTVWPRREQPITIVDDPTRRPIFLLIPTVNEGPTILEATLRGAIAARDRFLVAHPHGRVNIVVCNDGRVANAPNWQDAERLAARLDVQCITRTIPGGAKAGNIEFCRQHIGATGDALIAIFDADQIAEPDFLLKTVPPFGDPTIGWVQTGQYYRNLDNPVAKWANDQQALFYRVLCPGKSRMNAAFICGTNVVIHAGALDEIGGFPQDSVTEDFAASIELHRTWRSLFLPEVLATGLGPMDLKSYFGQQRRWSIGTLGVLRNHWRAIFLPRRNGLRLPQRIQYALGCTHYLSGVRDLIYLIAPLFFLVGGISAVRGAYLSDFLWHFLPYWIISQIAFWHLSWRKSSLRGIILSFGSFPVLIGSLCAVLIGRRSKFTVTAKRRTSQSSTRELLPHFAGFLACVSGIAFTVVARNGESPVIVSALWVVYSAVLLCGMLMLGGMLWLGFTDWQGARRLVQARERRIQARPAGRRWSIPLVVPGFIVALVLAGPLVTQSFRPAPKPAHFVPMQETGGLRLGVTLPYELLTSQPPVLERQLGMSFGIVGRTQDIGDGFDRAWAKTLAEHQERPWITLRFAGSSDPTAAFDASLPAVVNGVHDDALRRWAQSVRAYGQPVYLTILPHVDRNWSLSSAVTNGGIPQDVPQAWEHVRKIFRTEGASNVAWVWAPAAPEEDEQYAPPASSIDVVLRSLISYPGTTWADPKEFLDAVSARYPSKPLFIEVGAAGPSEQKATWLRKVGVAVAQTPNVQGLLYHEGSPDPNATLQVHAPWSLASDPQSVRAFHDAALLDMKPAAPDDPSRKGSDDIGSIPINVGRPLEDETL